jgi:hypothetical protein
MFNRPSFLVITTILQEGLFRMEEPTLRSNPIYDLLHVQTALSSLEKLGAISRHYVTQILKLLRKNTFAWL